MKKEFIQDAVTVPSPGERGRVRVQCAFTLAEVLITLGIIGVVAAMTMPSLIASYQSKALETQVAKAKTVIANGYKLMTAKNDDLKLENLPMMTECNNLTDPTCLSKYHKDAFSVASDTPSLDADIMPAEYAIQNSADKSPFKWADMDYIFMTGDGMVFTIIPDETSASFSVVADVNGARKPNIAQKDLVKFRIAGDGGTLYDVSSELTAQSKVCSLEYPDACQTEEECNSVPEREYVSCDHPSYEGRGECGNRETRTYWRDGVCYTGDWHQSWFRD